MHGSSTYLRMIFMIPGLILVILMIVAACKIYVKAKYPGWAAIIPFYGLYILLKIVGRPVWWMLLYFIPIANIVVGIIVAIDLGKSFGKSTAFGVLGLVLFPIVGYLILGFSKDTYKGPAAGGTKTPIQPLSPQTTPSVPQSLTQTPASIQTPSQTPPTSQIT